MAIWTQCHYDIRSDVHKKIFDVTISLPLLNPGLAPEAVPNKPLPGGWAVGCPKMLPVSPCWLRAPNPPEPCWATPPNVGDWAAFCDKELNEAVLPSAKL